MKTPVVHRQCTIEAKKSVQADGVGGDECWVICERRTAARVK